MPLDGEYAPSPFDPIAEQVRLYEETGGKQGGDLMGKPCVILTTKGRKSGNLRKSPLMRVRDGDNYVVVASMGGAPKHPAWYLNLVANPVVTLQDGTEVSDYRARTASAGEKKDLWPKATEVWPDYDNYQASTDRDIPMVVLEPV